MIKIVFYTYANIISKRCKLCIMRVLNEVLTIREAAAIYGVHPMTVRRAIDARRNPLEARKSPDDRMGTWLVTRASCERRWGHLRSENICGLRN